VVEREGAHGSRVVLARTGPDPTADNDGDLVTDRTAEYWVKVASVQIWGYGQGSGDGATPKEVD
jgi:hypothetical protein